MTVAHRGPLRETASRAPAGNRPRAVSVGSRCHVIRSNAQQSLWQGRSRGDGDERGVAGPDGPDQPGELIGHRDDGQVEVAPVAHLQRPPVQAGQRLTGAPAACRGQHHRAAPVNQQASQVAVAAFADMSESCRPPLEYSRGVNPTQLANWRPRPNAWM